MQMDSLQSVKDKKVKSFQCTKDRLLQFPLYQKRIKLQEKSIQQIPIEDSLDVRNPARGCSELKAK